MYAFICTPETIHDKTNQTSLTATYMMILLAGHELINKSK